MHIDWEITQWFTSSINNIVATATAIFVAIFAYVGLNTWKKQLRGNTEYEIARRLLRSVYMVRDEVYNTRKPFVSGSEIAAALKEANMEVELGDPEADRKRDAAYYQYRWKRVTDAYRDLDVNSFEAEVLWGDQLKECLIPFRQQVVELYSFIELHIQQRHNPRRKPDEKLLDKMNDVLHSRGILGSEPNEYDNKFSAAIEKIEDFLRPRLRL